MQLNHITGAKTDVATSINGEGNNITFRYNQRVAKSFMLLIPVDT